MCNVQTACGAPTCMPNRPRLGGALMLVLVLVPGLGGCASTPVPRDVASGVLTAANDVSKGQGSADLSTLLQEPVTLNGAARIAVLRHPAMAEHTARLGLAEADRVSIWQALDPGFGVEWPRRGVAEQSLGWSVTGFLTFKSQLRASAQEMIGARALVIDGTLGVVGRAQTAMIDHIAAQQKLALLRQTNAASQAARQVAEQIFEAGNSAEITRDREVLRAEHMALSLVEAEAHVQQTRADANLALGLSGREGEAWTSITRLPSLGEGPLDDAAFDAEALAHVMRSRSLRLQAAAARLEQARALVPAAWINGLVPDLQAAATQQREDGGRARGQALGGTVPLVSLGAAARARAAARVQLAQAELERTRLEVDGDIDRALRDVRASFASAQTRRDTLLPLAARVFEGEQKDYNAMQSSVFDLLAAKSRQLDVGSGYIEALRRYWTARTGLDLMLAGGSLPPRADTPNPVPDEMPRGPH